MVTRGGALIFGARLLQEALGPLPEVLVVDVRGAIGGRGLGIGSSWWNAPGAWKG